MMLYGSSSFQTLSLGVWATCAPAGGHTQCAQTHVSRHEQFIKEHLGVCSVAPHNPVTLSILSLTTNPAQAREEEGMRLSSLAPYPQRKGWLPPNGTHLWAVAADAADGHSSGAQEGSEQNKKEEQNPSALR